MSSKDADKLFLKKYTCPVCENIVQAKTVKTGKARLISTDMDLRNVYDGIEPLKYDVIICMKCGYGALVRFFPNVTAVQQKLIGEKITPYFKSVAEEPEEYSYEQAISRYKIAFANAVVKMAKCSEGAYVSLKTAWLYRSYRKSLNPESTGYEERCANLQKLEKECMDKSYQLFLQAVQSESFPMCGMDEPTVDYLMAVLAMEYGDFASSSKLLSKILTSYMATTRLKDKARDVKEELAKRTNLEE